MCLAKKQLATACVLSVIGMACSGGVQASGSNSLTDDLVNYSLDEMVVTATRTEARIFDVNASVNVITQKDIERMHYENLNDALQNVPGVQFQNYGGAPGLNANMTTPLRINGSQSVLILVDGVRLTPIGISAGTINANFLSNLDNVERIEVLKGAAGVLYGSDAAGGVINIITKKADDNKTTLKATTGSFGKEAYHFANRGTTKFLDWNVYYDKDRQGNFKDGHDKEWLSNWNSHAGGVSLTGKINDKHQITFKYNESDGDFLAENPSSYYSPGSWVQYPGYQQQKGNIHMQDTTLVYDWQFDDSASNKLVYRTERYGMDFFMNNGYNGWFNAANNGYNYKTRVWSDQFTKKIGDKHTLVAGFDITKTQTFAKNNASAGWKELENNSYFVQDTWRFDDKWDATAGVRFDKAKTDINDASMDDNWSKSLSVGYNFDANKKLYVSYADFYILPTPEQIADRRKNDNRGGYYYGNNVIKPATGKNYSLGYNQKFDDKTDLTAHVFLRDYDRDIKYVKYYTGEVNAWGWPVPESAYKNVDGDSKDYGFDIQLNKKFDDKWSSFVGYTFLKHTSGLDVNDDRVKLGYLPKHVLNLGVNYTYDKWDVGLTGRGFLSRDDGESTLSGDPDKGGWPSSHYWLFDIAANYQATKNIKLFAVANNIFDTYYAESAFQYAPTNPGDAYAMPGRSFLLGAEVSF